MLALSRKKGDSIIINDNIEVVILSVQGEQVKVGIMAPKEISVHRKEIYELITNANKEAASTAAPFSFHELNKLISEKK